MTDEPRVCFGCGCEDRDGAVHTGDCDGGWSFVARSRYKPDVSAACVSDFIARRKAEREQNCSGREIGRQNVEAMLINGLQGRPQFPSRGAPSVIVDAAATLSRALSTPLPHDPPMSVRLMPWKGKADE